MSTNGKGGKKRMDHSVCITLCGIVLSRICDSIYHGNHHIVL